MARRKAVKSDAPAPDLRQSESARSLDPGNWSEFRDVAHMALDLALEHLEKAADRPGWQPVPQAVIDPLGEPLPAEAQDLTDVLKQFQERIQPYATGNTHPRFPGWVHGSGLADGVIAEMLSASMNAGVGGRDHGAVHVERQVIDWFRELFGFPEDASGLVVSGASMATLIGLTVARHSKSEIDVRKDGIAALPRRLVGYTSKEAHSSVARAFEMLGLGRDALRAVPVHEDFTMDLAALNDMIAADRAAGLQPFAVVATAGTVNTGAIDGLDAIADIATEQNLWLHVDGAFGALAILSPDLKPRLKGIERADSLAFDFHKWMHVPHDAGCILVRDRAAHLAALGSHADYLAGADRGVAAGEPWFCKFGPELSRSFRAFKVWFALKTHGAEAFGDKILDNCRQAAALQDKILQHPNLELLAPVSLNIACFRYCDDRLSPEQRDTLNCEVVIVLQELGIAAPSTTKIDGSLAIRANFTNHRTRTADVDILADAITRIGAELAADAVAGQKTTTALPSDWYERHERLTRLLAEPDLAPLARDLTIAIDAALDQPFRVGPGRRVTFAPDSLEHDAAARILVRHALECLCWPIEGLDDSPREIAHALAAARTSALYLKLRPAEEQQAALQNLPYQLRTGYMRLGELDPWSNLSVLLDPDSTLVADLLALGGGNPKAVRAIADNISLKAQATHHFAELAMVAVPVEQLLVGGDDPRLHLNAATGANGYGAEPRPVLDELSYASSTAASPSRESYNCAEAFRQRLISAACSGELRAALDDEAAALMCELTDRLADDAADTADIVLAPSGTHAVHTALALAKGNGVRPLLSVVVAPDETGSGVPLASEGRYFFANNAPEGAQELGSKVPGLCTGAMASMSIEIRTPTGRLRSLSDIDSEIEASVDAAITAGGRVLLFALDSSKLGTVAPSVSCLKRLARRHPAHLDIIVDACQLRLSPKSVAAYLGLGAMVQVTGSKFLGGVPFSGALLLPGRVAARAAEIHFPKGLVSLAMSQAVAERWQRHNANPRDESCLAMIARWRTATAELEAFNGVPAKTRQNRMRRLAGKTTEMFRAHPELKQIAAPVADRTALGPADTWRDAQTIFPFVAHKKAGRGMRMLSLEEARTVYKLMLRDLAPLLPKGATDDERRIASRRCHIGKPVKLPSGRGKDAGALRLCLNARSISRIGRRKSETLANVVSEITDVLDKAALIARHFDYITTRA